MTWSSSPTPNTSNVGAGEQPEEQDVGRGEVLELVDQQVPVAGLLAAAELAVGQQQFDGVDDLFVEVEDVVAPQAGAVRLDRAGEAGCVGLELDLVGIAQTEPDDGQTLEVRRHRVGVEPVGELGQVGLEPAAHLALVDHVGSSGAAVDRRCRPMSS